jgi:hypothetical protein
MTYQMAVPQPPQPPPPDAGEEPTAARMFESGQVEVICVGSRWHWRLSDCREWSRISHITMMDAYQGAMFRRYGMT